MNEKVRKVIRILAAPLLFLVGLVLGRKLFRKGPDRSATFDKASGEQQQASAAIESAEELNSSIRTGIESVGREAGEARRIVEEFRDTSGKASDIAAECAGLAGESTDIISELISRARARAEEPEDTEHSTVGPSGDSDCDSLDGDGNHLGGKDGY